KNTRHNIGFKVLDKLAEKFGTFFSSDRLADIAEIKYKGKILVLIKPTTYMNLSGKAVNYWLQKEKIPVEKMLVITDDIALPFGTIRIRPKGSDGGHNGLKSINESINTQNYPRLRFGVGNNFPKGKQAEYVLGEWNEEEHKTLEQRIDVATQVIKSFAIAGLQRTMNDFSNK
ncbi:MAG: aminoacyl-tRNA hydrolase, partial [Bacteroidia bacterium]